MGIVSMLLACVTNGDTVDDVVLTVDSMHGDGDGDGDGDGGPVPVVTTGSCQPYGDGNSRRHWAQVDVDMADIVNVQVCGFQSTSGYVFPPGKTPECWSGLGIFKLSGETWIDCGYSSLSSEGVVTGNFGTTVSVTTL